MGKWIPSLGLNPEFNPDQVLPCFSSSLHSFPLKTAMEKMKAVAWCTLNHLEHLTPGARIPSTPRCISICRSSCSRFRRSSFLRSLQKKSVRFYLSALQSCEKNGDVPPPSFSTSSWHCNFLCSSKSLKSVSLGRPRKCMGPMGSVPNSWDRSNWNCRGWEPAGPPRKTCKLRPLGPTNLQLHSSIHLALDSTWCLAGDSVCQFHGNIGNASTWEVQGSMQKKTLVSLSIVLQCSSFLDKPYSTRLPRHPGACRWPPRVPGFASCV